jgi:4'-phosphopantetheinyl transferase
MSLILDHDIDSVGRILVWRDEESLDFFKKSTLLTNSEEKTLARYTNARRQKEFYISRFLLQQIFPNCHIMYEESGRPYLQGEQSQISISHSRGVVAVFIHEKRIGGDIECVSTRAQNIKERFLSKSELEEAGGKDENLILFWSAKETLFKIDKEQGLDFRDDLSVKIISDTTLQGEVKGCYQVAINYLMFDEWVMTWGVVPSCEL